MLKLGLAISISLLLIVLPVDAFAVCSPYLGFATINEINKDKANGNDNASDFVEVKILDTSIPLSEYGTWTLTIQENGGQGPVDFLLSNFDDTTVPWLVQIGMDVAIYIDLDFGMNLILKDGSGDVIDYLDYDTGDGFTLLADGSCNAFVFDTLITSSSGGVKRIRRSPDGIGDWDRATAQSISPTEDTTNDDVPSGAPDVSAASITVNPGSDATLTVTLSTVSASDVVISYMTQDVTANAGSDYTSANSTVTIPAGNLSASFAVSTGASATSAETFNVLISSTDAVVLTSLVTVTFSVSASCGPIDSTYGIYSTVGATFGDSVLMNGSAVSSGTSAGIVGLTTNGSLSSISINIPGLDPSTFPENSAILYADDTDSPISGSTEVFYDDVFVNNSQNLYFTGNGPFHINTLTVDDDADVYFSAGTYYINNIIMRDTTHLRVSNSPVIVHIGSDLQLNDDKIHINEHDGGAPEDLRFYLHSAATITSNANNNDTKMKAIIVGKDNGVIQFNEEFKFQGSILSENQVFIGDDAELTLGAAQQTSIAAVSTCEITDFSLLCSNVYTGGLQTSSSSATVEFKDSSQLLSNPTSALPVGAIQTNHGSSCGGSPCTARGTVNDALTIPAFQYYSSGPAIEVNGAQTVGISDNEFEEIKVKKNGVLTFSSTQSNYTIKKLSLEDNTTINFTPGDYFIEEFKVDKKNVVINVIGSGTVRIWSISDIKFKNTALINSPSAGVAGTPSKLFIQTTKTLKLEDDATLSAFVSAKDFQMKDDSYLFGAATASSEIKLEDNATVSYVSDELVNTDFDGACTSGVSGSDLDHFLISHDGFGINCVAETISITAKDALDVTLDGYVEGITLDTQSNKGTWSLSVGSGGFADVTSNDGLATYSFVGADNGVAQFSLSYLEGAASLDLEAFQTSDTTLRDDDTESALVFSPSGFTLTQTALSNPPPSPINDPIVTQTAGSNFNVHLAAYGQTADDPDCGIIEAYTGDKNIAFWFDYENPSSGSISITIDGSAIAANEGASATQIINFVNGQASTISKYKDVGQIQLHAKDNAIIGTSNSFIVRPSDLVIVDIETVLGVNNPAAASATGSGFVTSGEAFTVVVESRDAEGSITPNFGNETSAEGIEIIASTLVLPAGGINGSSDDGAIANNNNFNVTATAGRFTGSNFSWDESGIIRLQASIADDNYLGTGEVTGTESGNVGRFYPATFDLNSSFVGASCNGFVYMDQAALTANYVIQARGLGGNVLLNYDLGLLGASGVASPVFYAENSNQGVDLISRVPIATSFWSNGVYSLSSSTYSFARLGNPDGPYENLSLGVSILDNLDGQLISLRDMNASTSADCVAAANCNAISFSGNTAVRYGRLEVPNAFGPETENLDVPLRSTYYDGSSFVVNASDSCTSYVNTDASLSNYLLGLPIVTVISPTVLNLLISGETTVTIPLFLSAPGAGNNGSVDVTYDAPAWLEYNWNGLGDVDPTGTASFGHFRGHDRVIYWREIFN